MGIAFDAERGLLVADTYNHRVRRHRSTRPDRDDRRHGTAAASGDGGPAIAASLNGPQDVAVDRDGNIFIADTYNALVRRIDGGRCHDDGRRIGAGPRRRRWPRNPRPAQHADGARRCAGWCDLRQRRSNSRVRRVAADGTITTVLARAPDPVSAAPGSPATVGRQPRQGVFGDGPAD
jgi:hypothetical protein